MITKYWIIQWKSLVRGYQAQKHLILFILLISIFAQKNDTIILFSYVAFNFFYYNNKIDFSIFKRYFPKRLYITTFLTEFLFVQIVLVLVLVLKKIILLKIILVFFTSFLVAILMLGKNYPSKLPSKFRLFPVLQYELNSFLRQKTYFLFFLLVTSIFLTKHLFFYFLLSMLVMEMCYQAFSYNESKEILNIVFKKVSLQKKVWYNTLYLIGSFLLLPTLLALFIHFSLFYITLYIFAYTILYCWLIILYKYANYTSKETNVVILLYKNVYYFLISLSLFVGFWELYRNMLKAEKIINDYTRSS